MTQEEKEILIRDLCSRLSYEVKSYIKNWSKLDMKYYEGVYTVEYIDPSLNTILGYSERRFVEVIVDNDDYEIKPYLFPLSSMTEEQEKECQQIKHSYYYDDDSFVLFDWYNKNHFDYRGLIEKGLAIDATGLNIY